MKKQMIFMMAGGLLALASCNNAATTGPSEAQIDSMVNAKLQVKEAELVAKNDSIINAMATMKADSMMMAAKAGAPTTASATRTTHTPKPAPKPETIGNGKPKMGDKPTNTNQNTNNSNTIGNGKPKMGDGK